MAKTVALSPAATEFARGEFARYYAEHPVPAPPRLDRREVAEFPFARGDVMRRHLAFARPDELRRFLAEEVPRHLYYSTAYFGRPDAPTMNEKEWLGADLVFDLDADHLRDAKDLPYPEQLRKAKERFSALLDDFLFGDFGFDPAETLLTFSGGRGYHAHLRSAQLLSLTSAERRELVDYILGIGVDAHSALVADERADPGAGGASVRDPGRPGRAAAPLRKFAHLAPLDAPGWQGRMSRAVLSLLDRWNRQGVEVAERELTPVIGSTRAHRAARDLTRKDRSELIRDSLSLDVFSRRAGQELLDAVLQLAAGELPGETDAPVTTDVHRLIRWPGSLHGGTGLRVLPLTRRTLDAFEPLRDAPVPARNGATVAVEFSADVRLPFGAGEIAGRAGEREELAAPAALFCLLRGDATLAGASSAPPG
jgi:DNA primase small subunit